MSALYALKSRLIFEHSNIFRNNSALVGAGINLIQSLLHLQPHTNILFENNRAAYVGGAMYIESEQCFLELDLQSLNSTIINFINNTAATGSSVYGDIDLKASSTFPILSLILLLSLQHQRQYASVRKTNIIQTVLHLLMFTTLKYFLFISLFLVAHLLMALCLRVLVHFPILPQMPHLD